jgi:hypothetical protein
MNMEKQSQLRRRIEKRKVFAPLLVVCIVADKRSTGNSDRKAVYSGCSVSQRWANECLL